MFSNRAMVSMVISISVFLVFIFSASLTYAYFHSARNVVTTVEMHGGVELTITGYDYLTNNSNIGVAIPQNSQTGRWQHKLNGGANWTTTINANDRVVESLQLSGLMVKAKQNAGTYVRVFVAVKINAVSTPSQTDGDLTIPSLAFVVDNGASVQAQGITPTTKESAFITANTSASTTLYTTCVVVTLPSNSNDWVRLFNHYTVFELDRVHEQDANYQHAQITAMVMLSATTNNTQDGWNEAQTDAVYSFSY